MEPEFGGNTVALLPKSFDFFGCFESSARTIHKAAELTAQLFANGRPDPAIIKQLEDLEHEGDRITHETMERLNKTFITPIDREDIHTLIVRLDDILDLFYAAASRYLIYKVGQLPLSVHGMARLVLDTVREMEQAIVRLRESKNPNALLAKCIEVNRLENVADDALRKALGDLFEQCANPIELIKIKEILENLEAATDACEDVADVIEGIVLKHA